MIFLFEWRIGDVNEKKVTIIIIIIALLVLLIPVPRHLKDGGTVEYQAILYKVSIVHSLNTVESEKPYSEGIILEILGFEIYENVS